MTLFREPVRRVEIEGEVWPRTRLGFKVELNPPPPLGEILRGVREFAEDSLPLVFDKEWRKDFEKRGNYMPLERIEELLGTQRQPS